MLQKRFQRPYYDSHSYKTYLICAVLKKKIVFQPWPTVWWTWHGKCICISEFTRAFYWKYIRWDKYSIYQDSTEIRMRYNTCTNLNTNFTLPLRSLVSFYANSYKSCVYMQKKTDFGYLFICLWHWFLNQWRTKL